MHREGKGYRILVFGQWQGVFGMIQSIFYATSIARCNLRVVLMLLSSKFTCGPTRNVFEYNIQLRPQNR